LGADSTISFRLDYHTEWELEYWRSIQPNPPSRSQAIRQFPLDRSHNAHRFNGLWYEAFGLPPLSRYADKVFTMIAMPATTITAGAATCLGSASLWIASNAIAPVASNRMAALARAARIDADRKPYV
jgi:hypothetical protein